MMLRRMIRWIRIARGSKVFGYSAGTFSIPDGEGWSGGCNATSAPAFACEYKSCCTMLPFIGPIRLDKFLKLLECI